MLSSLSSSPYMASIPRSSSPLNPFRSNSTCTLSDCSSPPPPISSPTPPPNGQHHDPFCQSWSNTSTSISASPVQSSPTTSSSSSAFSTPKRPGLSQRFTRPAHRSPRFSLAQSSNRSSSSSTSTSSHNIKPLTSSKQTIPDDLFASGTTPTEGAMWREKFARRIEDRARRRRARDEDLANRRGINPSALHDLRRENQVIGQDEDDETERQAQADDEEIFRRLIILQRRKAYHTALVSYETDTGGSDPNLPEFWEQDLDEIEREERALLRHLEDDQLGEDHHHLQHFPTPMDENNSRPSGGGQVNRSNGINSNLFRGGRGSGSGNDTVEQGVEEEEQWAIEAAAAEEAEREAEELEAVAIAERAYFEQHRMRMDLGKGLVIGEFEGEDDDMDMD